MFLEVFSQHKRFYDSNAWQKPTSDSTVEIKLTSDNLDFAAVTETSFGLKHIPKACIDKCVGSETNFLEVASPTRMDILEGI